MRRLALALTGALLLTSLLAGTASAGKPLGWLCTPNPKGVMVCHP